MTTELVLCDCVCVCVARPLSLVYVVVECSVHVKSVVVVCKAEGKALSFVSQLQLAPL